MHTVAERRPGTEGPIQFLSMSVGTDTYAAAIDSIREILEVGQMTALPQTPPFVRGVMNLRGAVVPVIDLGARFGDAPATLDKRSCVIIVESPLDPAAASGTVHVVGMLVGAVHEVFECHAADLEAVPPMGTRVAAEHLSAMTRLHGQSCPVLDLERLLAPATLAELIAPDATTDHR